MEGLLLCLHPIHHLPRMLFARPGLGGSSFALSGIAPQAHRWSPLSQSLSYEVGQDKHRLEWSTGLGIQQNWILFQSLLQDTFGKSPLCTSASLLQTGDNSAGIVESILILHFPFCISEAGSGIVSSQIGHKGTNRSSELPEAT